MARTRPGYTLMEMIAVLAIILILASVTYPTFRGLKGNSDQKAAADAVRGQVADARGLAMFHGQPYRMAVSSDGTRVRIAPDTLDFSTHPAASTPSAAATAIELKLERATAAVEDDEYGSAQADGGGWITVGTFLPDGTCRAEIHPILAGTCRDTRRPLDLQGLMRGRKSLWAGAPGGAPASMGAGQGGYEATYAVGGMFSAWLAPQIYLQGNALPMWCVVGALTLTAAFVAWWTAGESRRAEVHMAELEEQMYRPPGAS